jgi:predicted dehydrogenase
MARFQEEVGVKTYRAAVIGCSRMGGFIDHEVAPGDMARALPYSHAACYEACERTDLVACADLREDVMERFGKRYDIPKERRYTDFRELIRRERPEIVSVATQPEGRAEIIIHAVDHGARAIYAEKALCTTLQEADAIVEAVERNGAVLNLGTQRRWDPGFDTVKRLLDSGELGPLKALIIHNNMALWDGSSHHFDTVMRLNDDHPVSWVQAHLPGVPSGGRRAYAHGTDFDGFDGDDVLGDPSSHGIIQFTNGVVAYALVSGRGNHYDVVCDRGTMSCIDNGRQWQMRRVLPPNIDGVELAKFEPFPDFEPASSTLRLVEDLVHSLDTGEPPRGGVRVARAVTELIFAFIVSHLRGGARVELPLKDVTLRHRRIRPPERPKYEPRHAQ